MQEFKAKAKRTQKMTRDGVVETNQATGEQTRKSQREMDLCQYFGHKKLKVHADFFNSSSSFCWGVI